MNKCNFDSYLWLYDKNPFSGCVNTAINYLVEQNCDICTSTIIGYSVEGVPIQAVRVGCGDFTTCVNATHHGREAINTILCLDQIKYCIDLIRQDACIDNINARQFFSMCSIVFVPLVNPDGADLVIGGESSISCVYKNSPWLDEKDFPKWKANIRGVDINENYPTKYPSIYIKPEKGFEGYNGRFPISEPETIAMCCLTQACNFQGTISYHSSGDIIFWYYNQSECTEERDHKIAQDICNLTGYECIAKEVPQAGSGYKDWFIENYCKPALTIEVSPYVGSKLVPAENYPSIYEKNKDVPCQFTFDCYKALCTNAK